MVRVNRRCVEGPVEQVTSQDGTRRWYLDGVPHRDDGPAIVSSDGWREWRRHGRLHRLDGAALEFPGDDTWYVNDFEVTDPEPLQAAYAAGELDVLDQFAALWDGLTDPADLISAIRAAG